MAAVAALSLYLYHYIEDNWQQHIVIAAGSTRGEAFTLAEAIADIVEEGERGLTVEVVETAGSGENLDLLESDRVEFALVRADAALVPSARLIAPLYPDVYQLIVPADSSIYGVEDLRDRSIALPPGAAGEGGSFWFLADHYGLGEDDVNALTMSEAAGDWAMLQGGVDAVFRVRAPGNAQVLRLIEQGGMRLVPIDQAAAMRLKRPALGAGQIPRGSYQGSPPVPETDLPTVRVSRLLVAHEDVDEDLVYRITTLLFEKRRELITQTPLAGFITEPDGAAAYVPVHPGARRFYDREKPGVLRSYAQLVSVLLWIGFILFSGFLGLRQRWDSAMKDRVDRYNDELVQLCADVRSSGDAEVLRRGEGRLLEILQRVVKDLDEGKVTSHGFDTFSFTWQAVHALIRDKSTGALSLKEVGR
jgi:TRAP transporter TAXI family solute receptor